MRGRPPDFPDDCKLSPAPGVLFIVMATKKTHINARDSILFLIIATALTIIISYIPFGWAVVYPIRLFVTFIHEGGHAAAALLTFGSVDRLTIFADASGVTYTRGGLSLLIASAGYLTSTLFGAALLVFCRDGARAKAVLTGTAAIILAITFAFTVDSFSWVTGILLTGGLIGVAIAARPRIAHFLLSFLAVQCCLNALFDLRTLFLISATSNAHSDAYNMQEVTLIPAVIWAMIWIILSLMALVIALRYYAEGVLAVRQKPQWKKRSV